MVGAGRVGTALAVLWAKAGHRIVAASGRDASRDRVSRFLPDTPFLPFEDAAGRGDVVLLGVRDDDVASMATRVSERMSAGRAVVHLSGSMSISVLDPARDRGATALSVHPLQTVPSVEDGIHRIPGAAAAVTAADEQGWILGERLARDAGASPFRIGDDLKPLYHAAAVFSSNYLTVVEALAERLLRTAGVTDPDAALGPLADATLANVFRSGARDALTGPAVRGDAGTVRRNLEALADRAPQFLATYVTLARAALDLAAEGGRLDPQRRRNVEEVLRGWT